MNPLRSIGYICRGQDHSWVAGKLHVIYSPNMLKSYVQYLLKKKKKLFTQSFGLAPSNSPGMHNLFQSSNINDYKLSYAVYERYYVMSVVFFMYASITATVHPCYNQTPVHQYK